MVTCERRSVSAIVEELAECYGASCETVGADGQAILLDVEVGELRCKLIRRITRPAGATSNVTLSPREKEIARMIAQGHPNKIIAGVLDISSWTVGTHVRHLFAKLQVTSRAQMVAKLSALGIGGEWNSPVRG